MSKKLLTRQLCFFLLAWILSQPLSAQVSCNPVFPNTDDDVTITFDATQGNGALIGISPVFAHMGVITNLSQSPSDWKHVTTTWGIADPVGAMSGGGNIWTKTFNIRTFFNIAANETVLQLAFVFRNTNGSIVGRAAGGADIFYNVYPENGPLETVFLKPALSSFLTAVGAVIPVKAASSKSGNLVITDNGTTVSSGTGELLETTLFASAGLHRIRFIANTPSEQDTSTFLYIVPQANTVQDPPAGTEPGIQIINDQTVRLSLYAPNKQVVYAIGDFSNWEPSPDFQMKKSTDGKTWWTEVTNITPGQYIRFQYLVDGNLLIADPLSTLVLDPGADPFVPAVTFPDMPAYPNGKTNGIVSVFRTAELPFNWTATNYERPKKTDLVVYELLLRDFIARHDYQTLLDTLDYLERLGVTAIELMPVNEFEGNNSWGYNPTFHKALDKYYGSPEALKAFVDACHQRNIAVILDVVFNQATGLSPLARLYWDQANNRPAADNPWLNPTATHDFNVFNDFNHESAATKIYVKNCLKYWLNTFKVDGFRFDLSKGFTQKITIGSTPAWGVYDPSRILILKDYANFMWAEDPTAYVILEHFADNTEEKELAEYGMMLWGNMYGAYKDVALGTPAGINASLSWVSYKQRNWLVPHLIGYMESHDENRIVYQCKINGAVSGNYNVKNLPTALRRVEMLNNLLYTIPGPKMLWEFGELGYDFSIDLCENGTLSSNCRTAPKPIRWDYFQDNGRKRLYNVTAALLDLRKKYDVFETTDFQTNISSGKGRTIRLNSAGMNVFVMANIGITEESVVTNFAHTGQWFEYYTGNTIDVSNTTAPILLQPGEYRLYTDQQVPLPSWVVITGTKEAAGALADLNVYPNPGQNLLSLDFSLRNNSQVKIDVRDMTGKLVQEFGDYAMPSGDHHLELDANTWPNGIYWIAITDENGFVLSKKWLKL
jgi:hypothetical protein